MNPLHHYTERVLTQRASCRSACASSCCCAAARHARARTRGPPGRRLRLRLRTPVMWPRAGGPRCRTGGSRQRRQRVTRRARHPGSSPRAAAGAGRSGPPRRRPSHLPRPRDCRQVARAPRSEPSRRTRRTLRGPFWTCDVLKVPRKSARRVSFTGTSGTRANIKSASR